MPDYRLLAPEEMPAAVDLWVDVFGVERPFFQSLLDGGEPDDFSVGAFEDGRIVSSVHVFMRRFRDRAGKPQKVGGIGSVSTHPDFRAKGHSAYLLDMAIAGMAARECVWSYLGTGINRHYARHGWRTVSTAGLLATFATDPTTEPLTPESVTDILLDDMSTLHAERTANLPMANDRTPAHWRHAVRYRVSRPDDQVFTARQEGRLVGYLVTRRAGGPLELVEGIGEDVAGLVAGALAGAGETRKAVAMTPLDSDVTRALRDVANTVAPSEDIYWMALPIADRISWVDLAAILSDPRGRRSDLDNF